MGTRRITRVNELIRREIGTALYRVVNDDGFDVSAVTVTHVVTSSDLRTATVMVSIRGDEAMRGRMLGLISRHRAEIQQVLAQNVILKYTPRLRFSLDTSLAEGDHVLEILRGIENTESPENE